MLALIIWLISALVLVTAVFVVASVMERGQGVPGDVPEGSGFVVFWRSFRAGLRHHGRVARPVDTNLDMMLAQGVEDGPAYVDAEQLADVIARARQQATRHIHLGSVERPAEPTGDGDLPEAPVYPAYPVYPEAPESPVQAERPVPVDRPVSAE
jgi:hypothetical protein